MIWDSAQINRGEVSEEELKARREKALTDPAIQNILKDPVMAQVNPLPQMGTRNGGIDFLVFAAITFPVF